MTRWSHDLAETPRPAPTIVLADDLADACLWVSRARDDRLFACARPKGHKLEHYGRDNRGPVRLGYGR